MARVVLTGSDSVLGDRVRALLDADPDVDEVVPVDLGDPDLKAVVDGAQVVVHLGDTSGPQLDGTGVSGVNVEGTRDLLDVAGAVGVPSVVLLSSATVYGAWPTNPIPLTEDAPVRPHPSLPFATHKAEVERLAHEWAEGHPGTTLAVLRPTVAVSEEQASWLTRSLWAGGGVEPREGAPPSQFVHLDDLAAAVDLARRKRLDGVFNVAPDGWIPADELRALAGRAALRLPIRMVARVAAWAWNLGLVSTPPGVAAYTVHPWVVANDRLRSEGWKPANTNEEAYVTAHPPTGWSALSPRRRQEVALGAAGVGVLGLVGLVVWLVRRATRGRG